MKPHRKINNKMKNKKQLKQEIKDKKTARNFIFILGWITLTLIISFMLRSFDLGILRVFILMFIVIVGWVLWKIMNKEKESNISP